MTTRARRPTLRGMDLAQHAAVLWRFRAVLAAGLAFGIVLAVLGVGSLATLVLTFGRRRQPVGIEVEETIKR